MIDITYSKTWRGGDKSPCFSIIIPTYNRASTIMRTINSVEKQTYRDFEIIVVDDGSNDDTESILLNYIHSTLLPAMYLRKPNGGVHTARNSGVKYSRGTLVVSIDSDDELTENALQSFYDAYCSIPKKNITEYREIVGRCVDENGIECGTPFPDNINSTPWKEAIIACKATKGEHLGCDFSSIRKKYYWPEPEGITFIRESILWDLLATRYKSWFINDIVRIYHTEGNDHLSKINELGYAKLTDTVRTIVKELLENGEAEYSYPEKTNNPNQKIRLK